MKIRTTVIISTLLILAVILAGMFFWNRLPDQVASHWDANDNVNGTMSKFWGVMLVPLMMIGLTVLFLAIPSIDPLRANIREFLGLFNIFVVVFNVFMAYVHGLTLAWNLGYTGFRFGSALIPAMGLLFILLGLGIRKAKRNYFIGIRTPWTLSSDSVWEKTHQLGGWMFAGAGIVSLLGIVFPKAAFILLMVPIAAAGIVPIVYSYYLWRHETMG
jgi:uncharacterized membrane protein